MRRTRGEVVFGVCNTIFLTLITFSTLLPFVNVICKSLSNEAAVLAHEVTLWPIGFNIYCYEYVLNNHQFLVSFANSVIITVIGTMLALILTSFAAYAMTKKAMPFGSIITGLYIITMFFGGGMIPTYLLYKQIGLYDNLLVLILPGAVSVFNVILMRNFFENMPPSLEEAAMIDGASYLQILFKIILPLSKAALATIGLFYAVGFWNSFFNAMLFTSNRNLMPLQLYLRNLVLNLQDNTAASDWEALTHVVPDSVRAATIICAMVPILLVYPFVQKYFVKGVMLGSVKE